ncbi:hypothetical protein FSO04_37335 [Paraburkholderia madseniana]|uniref:Uncharacterized protein n=1 Tax=Paraburkholderia madseniana TaxID=2599607 RepID=A0A6N6W5P8_9BURK|nr:hypothetical protein [Paraburkholderia madseniana]KAE8754890.1 hypothetical protein FSO04_37335 [Paraburkholderia madseniana]
MDMPLLTAHPGNVSDAAAIGHHALVPFTPQRSSGAGRTTTFLSAGPTHSAPGLPAPLGASDFHDVDPVRLAARLTEMFARGGPDVHAGIRAAAHNATRDARELDEHLGAEHGALLALPAPRCDGHEGSTEQAVVNDYDGDLEQAHHGDGDEMFDHADAFDHVAQGDHAGLPEHAHHVSHMHTPHASVQVDAANGHDEVNAPPRHAEQQTTSSPGEPAVASPTEDALSQQAKSMQQMIEYQTRASELNMNFKIQSDLLQSMQKMNSDSADAAKYQ